MDSQIQNIQRGVTLWSVAICASVVNFCAVAVLVATN